MLSLIKLPTNISDSCLASREVAFKFISEVFTKFGWMRITLGPDPTGVGLHWDSVILRLYLIGLGLE